MIIEKFIKKFHKEKPWKNTHWMGVPALKNIADCWIYQEIIYEIKPDVIIECGTAAGGGSLFLANMCDLLNKGRVITIDITQHDPSRGYKKGERPNHSRIKYLLGSSTSKKIVSVLESQISKKDVVMVILDSSHKFKHVLEELNIYSKFVTKGSYLIVEDTNLGGPKTAIKSFLKNNNNFKIDKSREKFLLTFNKNGFLFKKN